MNNRLILHNTGMDSKKYGSLERYLVRVADLCRDRGYRTVLQYESLPRSGDFLYDLSQVGAKVDVATSRSWVVPSIVTCSSLIAKHRPAVIHNHFAGKSWKVTVPIVGRMAGAATLVNSIHNDPEYRGRSILHFVYDRYDHILPVSEAVRSSFLKSGVDPRRVHTLYLGLIGDHERSDTARQALRQELGIPARARVLGCIAFAARFKGVDLLLEAFRHVIDSHDDVYLLQIGVDDRADGLRNLSRALGLDDRVIWAGVVDDGWRLLNAADAYVQPSRSAEGLPLALMEAMAMRLPIVCTRVSGNVEAILDGETGFVSDPDPDSLAAGINRLLAQPERWTALGAAAYRRYRQQFDGEVSVRTLVEQYYGLRAHR